MQQFDVFVSLSPFLLVFGGYGFEDQDFKSYWGRGGGIAIVSFILPKMTFGVLEEMKLFI